MRWATQISSASPGVVPERGKMRLSGSVLKGCHYLHERFEVISLPLPEFTFSKAYC